MRPFVSLKQLAQDAQALTPHPRVILQILVHTWAIPLELIGDAMLKHQEMLWTCLATLGNSFGILLKRLPTCLKMLREIFRPPSKAYVWFPQRFPKGHAQEWPK